MPNGQLRSVVATVGLGLRKALRAVRASLWSVRHPLGWWWRVFKEQPGRASTILLMTAFVTGVAIALILRLTTPYPAFVITEFETPTGGSLPLAVSGRTIANLVADELHYVTHESAQELILPREKSRPLTFSPELEPASVDVDVAGFSWRRLVAEWKRIRQHQYEVTGDLVVSGHAIVLRTRILPQGTWWEESVDSATMNGLRTACRRLALDILTEVRPDIAGLFHYHEGQWTEALTSFQRWATQEPDPAGAFFLIGAALQSQGETGRAREAFRQALTIHPDFPDALVALAENLFEGAEHEAEFEEIIALYDRALRLKPDLDSRTLVHAHESLGTMLDLRGDREGAGRHFAEAKRLQGL